jgi:DNA-binding winged helix-turn-helix (wHTH) protein
MGAAGVDVEEPIALGPFTVDFATARLWRDSRDLELRPQAFRALKVLLHNPGRIVDFEQMIREAWDGVQVSRHTVAVTVSELKQVLREYGSWITCRTKFGYYLEIPKWEETFRMGRHFRNQFTRAGFQNALHCFEQAARHDSADFRAFEAISSTCLMFAAFMTGDPRSLYRRFVEAHGRAGALRGVTTEQRLDRAYGHYIFEWNPAKAESELLQLQREQPGLPEVHARLAIVYASVGRLDDALAHMTEAHAAGALLPPLAFVDTLVRLYRRECDEAVVCGKKCIDLHPASQFGRVLCAEALELAGRHEEALAHYQLAAAISPDVPWILAQGARFMALTGRSREALEILDALERKRATEYVEACNLAYLLDALGKRDEAFAELERAYEERSYALLLMDVDPKADRLRGDPRFARLRSKVFGSPQPA